MVKREFCRFICIAVCSLLAVPLLAEKIPVAAWQSGVLASMDSHVRHWGPVVVGDAVIATDDVVTAFTLRGSQYIYHADRASRMQDKPLHLTIHENVEFAIVGRSIYLKDEDGKAHKLAFVSKELRR
jgi:hypothetical protein